MLRFTPIFLLALLMLLKAEVKGQLLSDTLDVTSYNLELTVTDFVTDTIRGNATLQVNTRIDGVTSLRLELASMIVDEVLVDGTPHAFTYNGANIFIPVAMSINDAATLSIQYHGKPMKDPSNWGGWHFAGEYAFNLGVGFQSDPHNLGKAWFPCVDDFHDRASYTLHITVPEGKKAICSGLLQEVTNNNDNTTTYHWQHNETLPTYLASVAVGDYVLYEETYQGITANIPINIYTRPSEATKVAGSFANLKQILNIYETHFGPYPFARIGYVGTATGAMEHATNIAYPHGSINGNLNDEWLYAHELAHMWFGNQTTCTSAEEMWLNEGWARYCETLYREFLYNKVTAEVPFNDMHKAVLQFAHTPSGDGEYYALNDIPTQVTYGKTAYDKGATVVHTLRHYMGDEKFFDGVKYYLQHHNYQYASSHDLMTALESSSGMSLEAFFQNWVYSPGHPHYSVDSFHITPQGSEYLVQVWVKQKLKGRNILANNNKFMLTFVDSQWHQHNENILFSGETGTASYTIPFAPSGVFADYFNQTCDATTDENIIVKEPEEINVKSCFAKVNVTNVADSALIRITHHWAAPDAMSNSPQGLTLSNYRYWSVDGIWPDGFTASAAFMYNKNGFLDNELITNSNDSLVLLWRPNTASQWQGIPFERTGPWSIGYLHINELKKGEYTLAMWDEAYIGLNDNGTNTSNQLLVSPNPATQYITIKGIQHQATSISLTNMQGKVVIEKPLHNSAHTIQWNPGTLAPGTYILHVTNGTCHITQQAKVIWKP